MITQFITDSPEALEVLSSPEPKDVWIHGSITYIYTGEDYKAPEVEIPKVSAWQIRKALNALSLREAVEAAILSSKDQNLKDAWEYATEFERTNQLVVDLGAAIGKTEKELDDLFLLAASL